MVGQTDSVRWVAAVRWLCGFAAVTASACGSDPGDRGGSLRTTGAATTTAGQNAMPPAASASDGPLAGSPFMPADGQRPTGSGAPNVSTNQDGADASGSPDMAMPAPGQSGNAPGDAMTPRKSGVPGDPGGGAESIPDGGIADASTRDDTDVMSVCAGGVVGMDSMSTSTPGLTVSREYGAVKYLAASGIEILNLKTRMEVPLTPSRRQVLFIWPALQCKDAPDPARIRNGILQPVLTWGPSCNPRIPRSSEYYDKWWIAGMYVNVSSRAAGPTGCAGGDYMLTDVGDLLDMEISLQGSEWTQTVVNTRTTKAVDFTIDLQGQVQNWATWAVEVPSGETITPAADTIFTQSVLTFSSAVTTCQPSQAGTEDYFSAPVLSRDGLHCCYDRIILRKRD